MSSPLVGRVCVLEANTYTVNHFGGADFWLGGIDLTKNDVMGVDEYLQPGSSNAAVNGTQTAPSPNTSSFNLLTKNSNTGYPTAGTVEIGTGQGQLLSYDTWANGGNMHVLAGTYTAGQVYANNQSIGKNYIGQAETTVTFDAALAKAVQYGKLFCIGEHGVAPQRNLGSGAGSKTDWLLNGLLPWLIAHRNQVAFLGFQGNVPPVHPYLDFDDANQAACTAAFVTIMTDAALSGIVGTVTGGDSPGSSVVGGDSAGAVVTEESP